MRNKGQKHIQAIRGKQYVIVCAGYCLGKAESLLLLHVKIAIKGLQPVPSSFILDRNIPAMPMTCLQVTHKSSGFFIFGYCLYA